jgi:hypothetical protein
LPITNIKSVLLKWNAPLSLTTLPNNAGNAMDLGLGRIRMPSDRYVLEVVRLDLTPWTA